MLFVISWLVHAGWSAERCCSVAENTMTSEVLASLVDAAIPFFAGIYATLFGYRILGKKPGQSLQHDEWHQKYGRMFKTLGPFLILFGVFRVTMELLGKW